MARSTRLAASRRETEDGLDRPPNRACRHRTARAASPARSTTWVPPCSLRDEGVADRHAGDDRRTTSGPTRRENGSALEPMSSSPSWLSIVDLAPDRRVPARSIDLRDPGEQLGADRLRSCASPSPGGVRRLRPVPEMRGCEAARAWSTRHTAENPNGSRRPLKSRLAPVPMSPLAYGLVKGAVLGADGLVGQRTDERRCDPQDPRPLEADVPVEALRWRPRPLGGPPARSRSGSIATSRGRRQPLRPSRPDRPACAGRSMSVDISRPPGARRSAGSGAGSYSRWMTTR